MPRLSTLTMYDCPMLKQVPYQAHYDAFPALSFLCIEKCDSQLLKGVGKLESLKTLHLKGLNSLQGLAEGLSEISEDTKLESLVIKDMYMWKEWSLPSGIDVFSNLVSLDIDSCQSLVKLPALGGLKNLEILNLRYLRSVTYMGKEFLGMSNSNDQITTSFPNLQKLEFNFMPKWEKWEVPFEDKTTEFFPKLTKLEIRDCANLEALPALGKLNSLQDLELRGLHKISHMGFSSYDDGDQDVRFPKLTRLAIFSMDKWERDEEMMETNQNRGMKIMPRLEKLILDFCPKLTVIPSYMFSCSLKSLVIDCCPNLSGRQPCLPSGLEQLVLRVDVGEFSTSLPLGNSYHKLTDVKLSFYKCKVLPKDFDRFTAIERLEISNSHELDFLPENFNHLSNLQKLLIYECSTLSKSCIKGKNWRFRIPEIFIDGEQVKVSYNTDIHSRKRKDKKEKEKNRKDKHAKKSDYTA